MNSESFRIEVIDFGKVPERVKPEMKMYEIWLGKYHLGQGSHYPTKPEKVAEIEATSFNIACLIYEHQNVIDSLKMQMERGDTYIEDIHFGVWYYNPKNNSNSWTGRYYTSREEAETSF